MCIPFLLLCSVFCFKNTSYYLFLPYYYPYFFLNLPVLAAAPDMFQNPRSLLTFYYIHVLHIFIFPSPTQLSQNTYLTSTLVKNLRIFIRTSYYVTSKYTYFLYIAFYFLILCFYVPL